MLFEKYAWVNHPSFMSNSFTKKQKPKKYWSQKLSGGKLK